MFFLFFFFIGFSKNNYLWIGQEDACNRIIVIVRHVDLPNYENRSTFSFFTFSLLLYIRIVGYLLCPCLIRDSTILDFLSPTHSLISLARLHPTGRPLTCRFQTITVGYTAAERESILWHKIERKLSTIMSFYLFLIYNVHSIYFPSKWIGNVMRLPDFYSLLAMR
jgi:hypothetical protein